MTIWVEIAGKRRRVDLPEAFHVGGKPVTALFAVDGKKIEADARTLHAGALSLIVEGRQYFCVLDGDEVLIDGHRFSFSVADPRSLTGQKGEAAGAGGSRVVKAPMPGRVVRVLVEAGDDVEEHQGLVVIEAMKMQNELKSPKRGRVVKITATAGTTVSAGDVLAIVE